MMKECATDVEARQEMAEKSLVQHWDSVVNYVPEMNRISCVCFKIESRHLIGSRSSVWVYLQFLSILTENEYPDSCATKYGRKGR
jgi:hypothetical protein